MRCIVVLVLMMLNNGTTNHAVDLLVVLVHYLCMNDTMNTTV